MNRNEKIARGGRAKDLLESEMFTSTLDELVAETFGVFSATEPLDENVREGLYRDMRAIQRLRDRIAYFVEDAKVEVANANYDK